MNYFRMFPGDYLRDTSHLTPLQHGCFLLLLLTYYARGKALPSDKPSLYRIASAMSEDEREAVDFVSESFFEKKNGALFNKKAEELLAHDLERVESAKRSANARWNECERIANASKTHMRTQCSPAPAPAPAPEPSPNKEYIQKLSKLFKRKDSTAWSKKEDSTFKDLLKRSEFEKELAEVEVYYNSGTPYLRQDLQTLLNNWVGELDRSRKSPTSQKPKPSYKIGTGMFAPEVAK